MLEEHGLADTSNTLLVVSNADQDAAVKAALAGIDGLDGSPGRRGDRGRRRLQRRASIDADVSSQAAFDTVEAARDAVHAVPDADALVGGGSAFYLDTKTASARDNKVDHPAGAASWCCSS